MDFSTKSADKKNSLQTIKTDCLAIGIDNNGKPACNETLPDGLAQAIQALYATGDITGKPGTVLLTNAPEGLAAKRLLLVGLGDEKRSSKDARKAIDTLTGALKPINAKNVLVALPKGLVNGNTDETVYTLVTSFYSQTYQPGAFKKKKAPAYKIQKAVLYIPSADTAIVKKALAQAKAINEGRNYAKDLGNLPANICTPSYLAKEALSLAKQYGFTVEVLEKKQIESLKMGSFLSVAKGSDEPPRLIVLKHTKGKAKEAPAVLVGKGITFDSGGISLKPGTGMDEMKYDMCGAASVLGTFKAIGEMGLKSNVIGIIPTCENMPSGKANKPGDIVTSMSGQTIEILNTDAEGRLILCDALTYAERFKPDAVVDIATLTGACIIALGHIKSGLFTREDEAHDALAAALTQAAKSTNDPVWRLPVDDAYQSQLDSNFADMANVGGRPAGSITAACFLERFTKQYTWAHLDVAGTAWTSGKNKGATGRPVPLLCQWLIDRKG
ncbi:MAG: leucyl aminopeptidase [Oxalobacter sp.]|nr:leucyl aminopeptidase [Oxalobacter sp.]